MNTVATFTNPTARVRRLLVATALVIVTFGMLGATAAPAQAATRAYHPTATCNNVSGAYGKISVHHGVVATGWQAESVGVAYTIQRWNGRSWYNSSRYSYLAKVYPNNQSIIQLPPVHTVHSGYYRVWLALSWYQNGVKQSWSGWVQTYNQKWGSVSHGWCTV